MQGLCRLRYTSLVSSNAIRAALTSIPFVKIFPSRIDHALILFPSPLSIIGAIIAETYYRENSLIYHDFSFGILPVVISNQVVQSVNIITTNVPALGPFMETLESGLIRTDDIRRRTRSTGYHIYSGPYAHSQSHASTSKRSQNRKSGMALRSFGSNRAHKLGGGAGGGGVAERRQKDEEEDMASISSQAKIIKKTTSYSVHTEASPPDTRGQVGIAVTRGD